MRSASRTELNEVILKALPKGFEFPEIQDGEPVPNEIVAERYSLVDKPFAPEFRYITIEMGKGKKPYKITVA